MKLCRRPRWKRTSEKRFLGSGSVFRGWDVYSFRHREACGAALVSVASGLVV